MAFVKREDIELARAGQGAAGFRMIPLTSSSDHDNGGAITYTLNEARRLLQSGTVRESDPLFPILIDIIANDGNVG